MKEITAIIVLALIFVGLGFVIGRFTAPGSDVNYKNVIAQQNKNLELERKIAQTYMIMYERLLLRINDLMSGVYYPPDASAKKSDL